MSLRQDQRYGLLPFWRNALAQNYEKTAAPIQLNPVYVKLPPNLMLKISLEAKQKTILGRGIITFMNGSAFQIPFKYKNLLLDQIFKNKKSPNFLQYSQDNKCLEYRVILKRPQNVQQNYSLAQKLSDKIIQDTENLIKGFNKVGMHQQFSKSSLLLKKARLGLMKNICMILTTRNPQGYKKSWLLQDSLIKDMRQGCAFKKCKQITQVQNVRNLEKADISHLKKSNQQSIGKRQCRIIQDNHTQQYLTFLAIKRNCKIDNQESKSLKLEKQYKIINKIQNPLHSIKYWYQQDSIDTKTESSLASSFSSKTIYMDYLDKTLDQLIYLRQNSISDLIQYSKQIICGVQILHYSGIVHRDLKPNNILVQFIKSKDERSAKKTLKIIDFGESTLISKQYSQQQQSSLGYTISYSPIQCFTSSIEGYNKKQIDYWSTGLILHELFFKKNPLTLCPTFVVDIYNGWKITDQFSIYCNLRKKTGCRIIQQVINILTINSLCIKQDQRICLEQMKGIYQSIESYLLTLKSI